MNYYMVPLTNIKLVRRNSELRNKKTHHHDGRRPIYAAETHVVCHPYPSFVVVDKYGTKNGYKKLVRKTEII